MAEKSGGPGKRFNNMQGNRREFARLFVEAKLYRAQPDHIRLNKSEAGFRVAFKGEISCAQCAFHLPNRLCRKVAGSEIKDNFTCDLVQLLHETKGA